MVTAASFQLRNLESDSLPMIGLAVQMRLRGLIEAMIAAKQHRVTSNHLPPPPMYPSTGVEGELPAPMWDQVLYDDVEKILTTIDRVEREEEKQARKDRLKRDQAEQETRERLERLAQEGGVVAGMDGDHSGIGGEAGPSGTSGDTSMFDARGGGGSGSTPGTPMNTSFGPGGPLGSKGGLLNSALRESLSASGNKDKKRKRENPTQTARNMSDDVRKKLSDQTAMRTLGTKKRYSWMAAGGESPIPKRPLPKPKFPPHASSLSIATNASDASPKEAKDEPNSPSASTSILPSALARLNAVPPAHEASRTTYPGQSMAEDISNKYVTIRDAIFVMENERGKGAGVGSGTKALFKAHMGRV